MYSRLIAASSREAIVSPVLMRCRSRGPPASAASSRSVTVVVRLDHSRLGQPDPPDDPAPARLTGGDAGQPRLVVARRAGGPVRKEEARTALHDVPSARPQQLLHSRTV